MFAPLAHSSAFYALAVVAAAMLALYVIASRRHVPGAAVVLRLLSVAALVIPAWTLMAWYRDLSMAREAATRMAIRAEPVIERAAVNGVALVCLGFLVMIGGIWLARRTP